MMNQRGLLAWPWAMAWAVLFAIAYTQSPLYFSNQHQYYVHGLAQAKYGLLHEDWLANTADPTPLFSRLVASTYRQFGPWMYQAYYFVLLGFYLDAVRRFVSVMPRGVSSGPGLWVFLTLFVASHAAIVRYGSVLMTGVDYPWYLQAGVAGQYTLGPGLQPSAFGVLLIAALGAFARGRTITAAVLVALAAVCHSTYLIPSGLLTVAFVARSCWERQWRVGLIAGFLALAIVAPVLYYVATTFSPDDYDRYLESRRVIAEVRIPHHCVVTQWLDGIAIGQCVVMLIGTVLMLGSRVFPVVAFTAVVCTILTLVAVASNSHALALMFPWRFSVILLPLSVALLFALLGRAIAALVERRPNLRQPLLLGCAIVTVVVVAGGVYVKIARIGYRVNESEVGVLDYIRDHKQSGDVYLIPVRFPNLAGAKKGSISTTFTPPPRAKPGITLIPVDLQRFRLYTGAPLYVDFKSIPYGEVEILDWQSRVQNCERWYDQRDWDNPETWREVQQHGITHIVATRDRDIQSKSLQLLYEDDNYRLYRFKRVSDVP